MPSAKPALDRVGLIVASRTRAPARVTIKPLWTMVRTAKRFDSREPIAAVANMAIEMGNILIPVFQGAEPEDQLQIERNHEEDSHQNQVLAEHPDQPGLHRRDTGQREMDQRVTVGVLAVALPGHEPPQQDPTGGEDEECRPEPEDGDGCCFPV